MQSPSFTIQGPAGKLELITRQPSSAVVNGVAIICHPDPRQHGTMRNKVVTTVAQAFTDSGMAAVCFNFRGVGQSEGQYGHIQGESADLDAVISWVHQTMPNQLLWLAGFSFGSYISALAAEKIHPKGLISIAPPVNHYDFQHLNRITCPWLVIQGDEDEIVPYQQVQEWAAHPPAPLKLHLMHGVSHFFHGRLIEVREYIKEWIRIIF